MKSQNVPMTLLKVEQKEGTGKTSGKAYSFPVATLVDEDANVFAMNVSDEVVADSAFAEVRKTENRNSAVLVSLEFRPKGFDIAGKVTAIKLAKK